VEKIKEAITQEISPRLESLLKTLVEGVFGILTSLTSLVMHLLNAIVVPFLVFYLLKDFRVVTHRFLMLVPRTSRERVSELAGGVDTLLGKYFRGAIVVALLQGTIASLGLWAIGVNYPLVLGIIHGLLDFVPYVGFFASLLIASIVAFFGEGAVWTKVMWVVALYVSQKLLEDTVFVPRIIGKQVGLHPVLLILSLLVFGQFLGFVGLLIAVPATALIIAGVKEWEALRRERHRSAS
jgi:predicted PurR-regulated permease PerM